MERALGQVGHLVQENGLLSLLLLNTSLSICLSTFCWASNSITIFVQELTHVGRLTIDVQSWSLRYGW